MILRVLPSTLTGDTVWAPPSKSIMQRVVALATLAEGRTMIDALPNRTTAPMR